MEPETFQEFGCALLNFDVPAIMRLLQSLSADDVQFSLRALLSGALVGPNIDPTNILCAGDIADQHLRMPAQAIVLYDAALQHMDENRESIASDSDCAAASLNLIDLLRKQRDRAGWLNAVKRAARMPIKRPEQKIQIAYWLHQAGESGLAFKLYQQGMEAGASTVAIAMGVSEADLIQMGEELADLSQ
ncbi:MAG TPA: hypothetical protein VN937_15010 [Blastocatellia bacterium]|nr:hypothetical protein [Blastocatellia bacterium]